MQNYAKSVTTEILRQLERQEFKPQKIKKTPQNGWLFQHSQNVK